MSYAIILHGRRVNRSVAVAVARRPFEGNSKGDTAFAKKCIFSSLPGRRAAMKEDLFTRGCCTFCHAAPDLTKQLSHAASKEELTRSGGYHLPGCIRRRIAKASVYVRLILKAGVRLSVCHGLTVYLKR